MASTIWNSILTKLDEEIIKEKRNIILLVDNAACHKVSADLQNVNVQYLPPNTTALIQPLDQCIKHSFKAYYRQIIVRKQILALVNGLTLQEYVKRISLLDTLYFVKRGWWLVPSETIEKCFQKAKIILGNKDDEVAVLGEQALDILMDTENFNEYVLCDANLECYGLLSDEEIVKEVFKENNQKDDDEDDNGENGEENVVPETPSFREVMYALDILRKFISTKNTEPEELENLEEKIFKLEIKNMSQKKITDYFYC